MQWGGAHRGPNTILGVPESEGYDRVSQRGRDPQPLHTPALEFPPELPHSVPRVHVLSSWELGPCPELEAIGSRAASPGRQSLMPPGGLTPLTGHSSK